MASLAKTTSEIRIILKLFGTAAAIIGVLFLFFKGGELFKNIFFPTPPPPPKEEFGKLPQVLFPTQKPVSVEYRINTLSGELPYLSDRMLIYKIKTPEPTLNALQNARTTLEQIKFANNESKISNEVYSFKNEIGTQTIKYNIYSGNFSMSYDYIADLPPNIISAGRKKDDLYNITLELLQSLNLNISDVDQNLSKISYYQSTNGILTKQQSPNDASYSRLDLFQKNLGDYKMYYPIYNESLMNFTFAANESLRIVKADFIHQIPDQNMVSDYAIINTAQAYEQLQNGNAHLAQYDEVSSIIDITDVSLGYYLGDEKQQYLLPIYIFKGNNFAAYVNAIPLESSVGN